MVDLKTEIKGIKLENPTILASGILGVTKGSLKIAADGGAGAVTIKSITEKPREGHRNPVLVEVDGGFLNAVGYSNMGLENAKEEFSSLGDVGVPVIGSVVAEDAEGFARLAESFNGMGFSAIEIVLSCPHTPGYGLMAGQGTPETTYEITKAVREKTRKPVIVKLSPNVPMLGEVAKAAEKARADAINMGNTVGPGMAINLKARKPVLDFGVGGMSGPAIKPVMVRSVYDVYESVRIPIIGTGGIVTGQDAVEMMMAGASAVGIGTGIMYRGTDVFRRICGEILEFMKGEEYYVMEEMVGLAHGKK